MNKKQYSNLEKEEEKFQIQLLEKNRKAYHIYYILRNSIIASSILFGPVLYDYINGSLGATVISFFTFFIVGYFALSPEFRFDFYWEKKIIKVKDRSDFKRLKQKSEIRKKLIYTYQVEQEMVAFEKERTEDLTRAREATRGR